MTLNFPDSPVAILAWCVGFGLYKVIVRDGAPLIRPIRIILVNTARIVRNLANSNRPIVLGFGAKTPRAVRRMPAANMTLNPEAGPRKDNPAPAEYDEVSI